MSRYLLNRTIAQSNVILGRTSAQYRIFDTSIPSRLSEMPSRSLRPATSYGLNARLKKSTMVATAAYDQSVDSFPSIVIGPDRSIQALGTFAEAQAEVRNFK